MSAEKKILYFEGAGCETEESVAAGVGNCRIRTAFHAKDGKLVYIEILSYTGRGIDITGYVDIAHWITDGGDDCNRSRIPNVPRGNAFPYSLGGILEVVRKCGGDFDEVKVLPFLSGFYVFKDVEGRREGPEAYNYGDEFVLDEEALKKREEIRKEVYRLEYEARVKESKGAERLWYRSPMGGIWPNFSLWVTDGKPGVLSWIVHMNYENFCADIEIGAGSVRDCIKKATGWTDENYGDFEAIYGSGNK